MPKPDEELKKEFEKIVAKCGIETLDRRFSDDLDFHDMAVWNIIDIMYEAYSLGMIHGHKTAHEYVAS